jgi:hypothetical protein
MDSTSETERKTENMKIVNSRKEIVIPQETREMDIEVETDS